MLPTGEQLAPMTAVDGAADAEAVAVVVVDGADDAGGGGGGVSALGDVAVGGGV